MEKQQPPHITGLQAVQIHLVQGSAVLTLRRASLVAQTVKCLPTMRETRFQSLGREDLLEKEMATYSSILA